LLAVEHVDVEFGVGGGQRVHAVSDVSIEVFRGETLGIVGESGCGKSTLARAIVQLPRPTRGSIVFEGTDLSGLSAKQMRQLRSRLQIILQDPISSLNPRRSVHESVAYGLAKGGSNEERRRKVEEMFERVGLDPAVGSRRPHEFSGGQAQRICIARALISSPELVVCDEIVSALDVSIQAQILTLLADMKRLYGLTLVFISHDLAVVKHVSDRIGVMYLGRMCEIGTTDDIFSSPAHPYTRMLLSAVLTPDPTVQPEVELIVGELPSPINPPSGCRFRTRCPRAEERCAAEVPQLRPVGETGAHRVACHFPLEPAGAPVDPPARQASR
jgi:peptide/nickel transport system ATP-binding protein